MVHTALHPPPKVLIVGAGPGGLASAMLLARQGAEVTILERRERLHLKITF